MNAESVQGPTTPNCRLLDFIVIETTDVVGTNLAGNQRCVSVESLAYILFPPGIPKDTLREMNLSAHQAPAAGHHHKSAQLGVESPCHTLHK